MAAVERVVKHAVFSYTDPDGVYRTALRGDRISIEGDELARGERFDVFSDGDVDASDPLDGALAGEDEDLEEGTVAEVDLAAVVAELSDEQRAELAAALAGAASSPGGAEPTPLDVAAASAAAGDELGSTGVVDGSESELERPPLAANKSIWIDFRVRESGGRLDAAQLDADYTKPELQDDSKFVAPAAAPSA